MRLQDSFRFRTSGFGRRPEMDIGATSEANGNSGAPLQGDAGAIAENFLRRDHDHRDLNFHWCGAGIGCAARLVD